MDTNNESTNNVKEAACERVKDDNNSEHEEDILENKIRLLSGEEAASNIDIEANSIPLDDVELQKKMIFQKLAASMNIKPTILNEGAKSNDAPKVFNKSTETKSVLKTTEPPKLLNKVNTATKVLNQTPQKVIVISPDRIAKLGLTSKIQSVIASQGRRGGIQKAKVKGNFTLMNMKNKMREILNKSSDGDKSSKSPTRKIIVVKKAPENFQPSKDSNIINVAAVRKINEQLLKTLPKSELKNDDKTTEAEKSGKPDDSSNQDSKIKLLQVSSFNYPIKILNTQVNESLKKLKENNCTVSLLLDDSKKKEETVTSEAKKTSPLALSQSDTNIRVYKKKFAVRLSDPDKSGEDVSRDFKLKRASGSIITYKPSPHLRPEGFKTENENDKQNNVFRNNKMKIQLSESSKNSDVKEEVAEQNRETVKSEDAIPDSDGNIFSGDMDYTEVPVKRKRGRPRKVRSQSPLEDLGKEVPRKNLFETAEPSTKRKRKSVNYTLLHEGILDQYINEEEDYVPVKDKPKEPKTEPSPNQTSTGKRRGRPRKSDQIAKEASLTEGNVIKDVVTIDNVKVQFEISNIAKDDDKVDEEEDDDMPEERLEEEEEEEEESDFSDEAMDYDDDSDESFDLSMEFKPRPKKNKRRGPGRPRKYFANENVSIQKRRGRKPKVTPSFEDQKLQLTKVVRTFEKRKQVKYERINADDSVSDQESTNKGYIFDELSGYVKSEYESDNENVPRSRFTKDEEENINENVETIRIITEVNSDTNNSEDNPDAPAEIESKERVIIKHSFNIDNSNELINMNMEDESQKVKVLNNVSFSNEPKPEFNKSSIKVDNVHVIYKSTNNVVNYIKQNSSKVIKLHSSLPYTDTAILRRFPLPSINTHKANNALTTDNSNIKVLNPDKNYKSNVNRLPVQARRETDFNRENKEAAGNDSNNSNDDVLIKFAPKNNNKNYSSFVKNEESFSNINANNLNIVHEAKSVLKNNETLIDKSVGKVLNEKNINLETTCNINVPYQQMNIIDNQNVYYNVASIPTTSQETANLFNEKQSEDNLTQYFITSCEDGNIILQKYEDDKFILRENQFESQQIPEGNIVYQIISDDNNVVSNLNAANTNNLIEFNLLAPPNEGHLITTENNLVQDKVQETIHQQTNLPQIKLPDDNEGIIYGLQHPPITDNMVLQNTDALNPNQNFENIPSSPINFDDNKQKIIDTCEENNDIILRTQNNKVNLGVEIQKDTCEEESKVDDSSKNECSDESYTFQYEKANDTTTSDGRSEPSENTLLLTSQTEVNLELSQCEIKLASPDNDSLSPDKLEIKLASEINVPQKSEDSNLPDLPCETMTTPAPDIEPCLPPETMVNFLCETETKLPAEVAVPENLLKDNGLAPTMSEDAEYSSTENGESLCTKNKVTLDSNDEKNLVPPDNNVSLSFENEASLPTSNMDILPPSNEESLPPSNEESVPASNEVSLPPSNISYEASCLSPSNEISLSPSNEKSLAPSNEKNLPPGIEKTLPPSNKASLPPSNEACLPPSNEACLPPSNEASISPSKEESQPPNKEVSIPSSNESSLPPSNEESLPPSNEESLPPRNEESLPPSNEESLPFSNEAKHSENELSLRTEEVNVSNICLTNVNNEESLPHLKEETALPENESDLTSVASGVEVEASSENQVVLQQENNSSCDSESTQASFEVKDSGDYSLLQSNNDDTECDENTPYSKNNVENLQPNVETDIANPNNLQININEASIDPQTTEKLEEILSFGGLKGGEEIDVDRNISPDPDEEINIESSDDDINVRSPQGVISEGTNIINFRTNVINPHDIILEEDSSSSNQEILNHTNTENDESNEESTVLEISDTCPHLDPAMNPQVQNSQTDKESVDKTIPQTSVDNQTAKDLIEEEMYRMHSNESSYKSTPSTPAAVSQVEESDVHCRTFKEGYGEDNNKSLLSNIQDSEPPEFSCSLNPAIVSEDLPQSHPTDLSSQLDKDSLNVLRLKEEEKAYHHRRRLSMEQTGPPKKRSRLRRSSSFNLEENPSEDMKTNPSSSSQIKFETIYFDERKGEESSTLEIPKKRGRKRTIHEHQEQHLEEASESPQGNELDLDIDPISADVISSNENLSTRVHRTRTAKSKKTDPKPKKKRSKDDFVSLQMQLMVDNVVNEIIQRINKYADDAEVSAGVKLELNSCTCAICKETVVDWSYHKKRNHNDLAWRVGETPLKFNNVQEVMYILNNIYKQRKPLYCETCGESKKSVYGYLAHLMQCGKSEDELDVLKIKCELCDHRILPLSLAVHMQQHRKKEEDPSKNQGNEDDCEIVNPAKKRKAARKATTLIQNATSEEGPKDPKEDSKAIKRFYVLDKLDSKFIPTHFRGVLKNSGMIQCLYPSCTYVIDNVNSAVEHIKRCEFKPDKSYICKKCCKAYDNFGDISTHIKSEHLHDLFNPETEVTFNEDEDEEQTIAVRKIQGEKKTNNTVWNICKFQFMSSEKADLNISRHLCHKNYAATLQFCKENYFKTLYDEHKPLETSWHPVNSQEVLSYLPYLKESMFVASQEVNSVKINTNDSNLKKLKLFESNFTPKGDTIIFTGGPVVANSWVPTPYEKEDCEQILAVSVISDPNKLYSYKELHADRGVIQFWNFGVLDNKVTSTYKPRLEFCLAHEFGGVFNLEWCPSGCYDSDRLGLLAVTSTDGCVYIYSIPQTNKIKSKIFKMKPRFRLLIRRNVDFNLSGHDFYPTRLSWSKTVGHELIAVGYSNGVIAFFDLNTTSSELMTEVDGTINLHPGHALQAHLAAVTGLKIIPTKDNKHCAVSSGNDRFTKYWNFDDIPRPTVSARRSHAKNIVWMHNWYCSVIATDDCGGASNTYLCYPQEFMTSVQNQCMFSASPVNAISGSDWGSFVIQGNQVGEIIGCHSKQVLPYISEIAFKRFYVQYSRTIDVKEKEILKSYKDFMNKTLVFGDFAMDSYFTLIKTSQILASSRGVYGAPDYHKYPIQAVNSLTINPNRQSFLYFAAGFQSGFLKVFHLKMLA